MLDIFWDAIENRKKQLYDRAFQIDDAYYDYVDKTNRNCRFRDKFKLRTRIVKRGQTGWFEIRWRYWRPRRSTPKEKLQVRSIDIPKGKGGYTAAKLGKHCRDNTDLAVAIATERNFQKIRAELSILSEIERSLKRLEAIGEPLLPDVKAIMDGELMDNRCS